MAEARHMRALGKHRVEALNDGIYAVAMTLLVLELKVPASIADEAVFRQELAHLVPHFVAWVISFFILAIFWISHQRAFHFVRVVDASVLWINLASLLLASLLPFSSSLIGEHPAFFAAQAFYAANMAALAAVAFWQITYLERHPELCEPRVPAHVAKAARFRCASLAAVALLAVAIAVFDPRFGSAAFMLMVILARIGRRIETREAARAAEQ